MVAIYKSLKKADEMKTILRRKVKCLMMKARWTVYKTHMAWMGN